MGVVWSFGCSNGECLNVDSKETGTAELYLLATSIPLLSSKITNIQQCLLPAAA